MWVYKWDTQFAEQQVLVTSDELQVSNYEISGNWKSWTFDTVEVDHSWDNLVIDKWMHLHFQLTEPINASLTFMCDPSRTLCLHARMSSFYTWDRWLRDVFGGYD
ncbi:hypothetical protein CYMTET_43993 [Cymbomonas tetramitiformis]|uniref:Uncharacterized protein n=1 Tax=Cymbomonas tetramitiformis TaxID=36881 RepID=A0AAE0F148_9CHLO|nr:hypothetical protein CYMTET_43993 [Cymbomonas tetramitiformis]